MPDAEPSARSGWWAVLAGAVREASPLRPGTPDPGAVLRGVLGVLLAVTVGMLLGTPADAALTTIGALLTGIPSLMRPLHHPAAVALVHTAFLTVSVFLGGLTGTRLPLYLVLLAVLGCLIGLTPAAGSRAVGIIANQTGIVFLIGGALAQGPSEALQLAAHFAFGGLMQVLTHLVPPGRPRLAAPRARVGTAYTVLADHAAALVDRPDRRLPATTLLNARRALDGPRGTSARRLAPLYALLAHADAFSADLPALAQARPADDLPRVAALRSAEDGLRALAQAIRQDTPCALPPSIPRTLLTAAETSPALAPARPMADRLRAAEQLTGPGAGAAADRDTVPAARARRPSAWHELPDQLRTGHSPLLRHMVRLPIALVLADLLGHTIGTWGGHGLTRHGFWIPLTVLLVLRPELTATLRNGWARGVGAVVAVLAVSALHRAASPTPETALLVVVVCAAFAYLTFNSEILKAFWITAWVVLVLSAAGELEAKVAWGRAAAAVTGCGIALLAYLLWPTWHKDAYPARLRTWATAQQTEFALLCHAWAHPGTLDRAELDRARRRRRSALALLCTATDNIAAEPARHGPWTAGTARTATGCATRIAQRTRALEGLLPGTDDPGLPEAAELGTALRTVLRMPPTAPWTPADGEDLRRAAGRATDPALTDTPAAAERARIADDILTDALALRALVVHSALGAAAGADAYCGSAKSR